jgi:hypothetical protein
MSIVINHKNDGFPLKVFMMIFSAVSLEYRLTGSRILYYINQVEDAE